MAFNYNNTTKNQQRHLNKYSKDSWETLEDIWPKEIRLSSEACKIIGVIMPAWISLKTKYKWSLNGIRFDLSDLLLLFWVQRCEEAKDNVLTQGYLISKQLSWNNRMRYFKQSRLHRLKLVENMPYKIDVYRVTAKGKLLMREFIDFLEQGHKDVKYYSSIKDEYGILEKNMKKYFELGRAFIAPEHKENVK